MSNPPTADEHAQPGPWHSRELASAAAGLLYTSEGDAPFEEVWIAGGATTWPPDAVRFAALVGAAPGAPVSEVTLDEFFARHIERADPADAVMQGLKPRFEALRDTLRRVLRDPRVFRVGAIQVRCYVVGADANGNLSGVVTTSFES